MLRFLVSLLVLASSCGSDREGAAQWSFDESANSEAPGRGGSDAEDSPGPSSAEPSGDRGDQHVSTSTAEGLAAVTDFCDAYPEIYCDYVWDCLDATEREAIGAAPTREQCRALKESLLCGLERSAEAGFVDVDPEQLEECERAARDGECFDVWACATKAVRPTLELGDACESSIDCREGVCGYDEPDVCAARTCRRLAGEGEGCTFTSECDEWLTCVDRFCIAPGPEGTFCDDAHPCDAGLECEHGRCSAFVATGEPNDPMRNSGDPCNDHGECPYDHRCTDGICALYGGIGSPCELRVDCHEWLACRNGSCVFRQEDGEPCSHDSQCLLLSSCEDGVCVSSFDQCEGMR